MVARHFCRELGFLSVVPGSKFPVMLLCQAPGYLSKIDNRKSECIGHNGLKNKQARPLI